jgi:regulator of CtrA degradation
MVTHGVASRVRGVMVQSVSLPEARPVRFAERLADSPAFKALFSEGMSLVEETAVYLDGDGRDEAKNLPRTGALAYAAESMRLTTRLMQLASWLLLQRAVNEGELSRDEASAEKHKVRLSNQDTASRPDAAALLPARLGELVTQSMRLQARIIHFDQLINPGHTSPEVHVVGAPTALTSQLEQLRAAFGDTRD